LAPCTASSPEKRPSIAPSKASPLAKRPHGRPPKKAASGVSRPASCDYVSSDDDDSSDSFDELEFMRKHMLQMGDKLDDKSKLLAIAQAKIATLENEVEISKSRAKTGCGC
jgi:hypothetical protein